MKFTLSWLRAHLETDAPLERITTTLSAIGLEVEGVEDRAAALAPFVTARVLEANPHPNADRLRVCRVDIGGAEPVQVVCGAPNARTGMAAVFAPPGSVIPGSGITLKVGEIRGMTSAGMLVSMRELALGEDHDGIIDLPVDTAPGQSYAAVAGLDDPVIEIGVTPNRGDALAVRGIARDLAAAGLGALKPWDPAPVSGGFCPVAWKNEFPAGCPWVMGRAVLKVKNGPSPLWLRRRLESVGLRPINALVDITNFFTIDLGRPLHVFDTDLLKGSALTVRRGKRGEAFHALDGNLYDVDDQDIVIADAKGPVGLAGIMGGKATGVRDETRNVFIECALFDPVRIALTGRRRQIHSDARARFERGVDPALLPRALDAATRMIMDICGGEPSEAVSAGAEPAWRRRATLRFDRLAGLGGAKVAPDRAVRILEDLGFTVEERDAARVTVAVPPWRNDVAAHGLLDQYKRIDTDQAMKAAEGAEAIEPECDLIEEVLRIDGLDRIAPQSLPPLAAVPPPAYKPARAREFLTRRVLAARGLQEAVTFSFMKREDAARFGEAPDLLELTNPIAADLDQMRPSPIGNLVLAAQRNAARGWPDVALFEVGPGYGVETQHAMAAGVRAGQSPRHWQVPGRDVGAMDAKADLLAVLAALAVPMDALSVTADAPAHYHPGRSGTVRQGPKLVLGHFGELHPALLGELGLAGRAAGFELWLDRVAEPKKRKRTAADLPALQPVRRDFAFLLPREVTADAVLRAVRGADRAMILRATLFDVYEGDKITAGEKSLGIEALLQPREHTLTDGEIENVCDRIVDAVGKLGGRLR